MEFNEEMREKLAQNFVLLCDVIQQRKTPEMKVDLSKLETILDQDIPNALKQNAPPEYYELYTDFRAEYDKFRDYILYDRLIGKNVVALGGGFSSGKSSFLNALNGEDALPANIDPTTSVPTYLVNGDDYDVMGINIFDTKVRLRPDQLGDIAHGFGEILDDDDEVVVKSTTLGHILESIFLATPMQIYKNIAFLDTPGYSKPDSKEYSEKTDADIARNQLNASNFILWFVQADAGTITEEDIKFIKSLHADIPKLIILTKADKKPAKDLADIVEKIRSTLDLKGVRHEGVYTFSSVDPEEYDSDKIRAHLEGWNSQSHQVRFAHNFKNLFLQCRKFYENERQEEGRRLNRLNVVTTKFDMDDEAEEVLRQLGQEISRNMSELAAIGKKVKDLQDAFFHELKFVGDIVGIPLPEPSEIDSLTDKVQDPLAILAAYKKKKGIRNKGDFQGILANHLGNIQPTLQHAPGGGEYKNQLTKIIATNCAVSPDQIKFNQIIEKDRTYQGLIRTLQEVRNNG